MRASREGGGLCGQIADRFALGRSVFDGGEGPRCSWWVFLAAEFNNPDVGLVSEQGGRDQMERL